MSRRRERIRNRRRKKPPNRWIILAQVGLLVGVILFLYVFGDEVVDGATNLVVQLTREPQSAAGPTPDAGGAAEAAGEPTLQVENPGGPDAGPDR